MKFYFLVILATAFLLQTAGFPLALLLFSKERKVLLRMLLESRGIPDPYDRAGACPAVPRFVFPGRALTPCHL